MSTHNAEQPIKKVADLVHEATDIDLMSQIRMAIRAVLTPLASLKLTVVLLFLAVFVIWVVTLEQTRFGMWTVKQRHFPDLFVWVPFQYFFPASWFIELQNVPGGFFMPSGTLLLVAMLVNLIAAHLVRMRIQAKGARLAVGAFAVAAGLAVTWGVVFYGQNPDGFQGSPPISYQRMWRLIQVGMLGLIIFSAGSIFWMKEYRLIERLLMGTFSLLVICVLGLVVIAGQKAFIGDSAMRILWQLIQSTIAALILLAGCVLIFKRKGGIVLLHFGIGLLMANELYVTMTNVEQRLQVFEGSTVSHVTDNRSTELMVLKVNDEGKHDIVMIPRDQLLKDQVISDEGLPFDVECIEYHPNSEIIRNRGLDLKNLADAGFGMFELSREMPVVSGVKQNEQDVASAYVRVIDKESKEDIGTFLMSEWYWFSDRMEEITVGGTTYFLSLRPRHYYKPYSVKLIDAKQEDYPGTTVAKSYSSDFILTDHQNEVSSKQRVWMNNPLRYGNETFYQTGMDTTKDGRTYTVLQVVKNAGWMIPYVACMIVVVGLFAQFGSTLLMFLEKSQQASAKSAAAAGTLDSSKEVTAKLALKDQENSWGLGRWIALSILVIMSLYVGSKALRASRAIVVKDEMRLDLLGQLPVTFGGRVKPLDSIARNALRQLSNRETITYPGAKTKMFGTRVEKESAIRWFADVIFKAEGYDKAQLIRVEDLSVAGALGLPKSRKGLKYSLEELNRARPELERKIAEAEKLEENARTPLQNRLYEVYDKLERVSAFQLSLDPSIDEGLDNPLPGLVLARRLVESSRAPRNVFVEGEGWVSATVIAQRAKIQKIATQNNLSSLREVAAFLVRNSVFQEERDELIRKEMIAVSLTDEESLATVRAKSGLTEIRDLAQYLDSQLRKNPLRYEDLQPGFRAQVDLRVREEIEPIVPQWIAGTHSSLMAINNKVDAVPEVDQTSIAMLKDLKKAYLEGDAETFNTILETTLASISETPPGDFSALSMSAEKAYNFFSPFYVSIVLYLIAVVLTLLGWAGIRHMQFSAFGLIGLALSIQILGILLRVVISGRPPVTNLYSSFVVVSAAAVGIMMIVEKVTKIGIGNMLAGVCGIALLLWAWTISIRDGDTFTVLVAVLDTQFWLSTHVMCISMGYSATVAAGLLGLGFLIASLMSPRFDKKTRATFGKLIYGIICFALLLSFFGTVLGGLWADDSWGRFWGWDPKENGALMIVFWNAVVLHARWAGMIRERGLAGLAVLGNVVTVWSWEGVNQLGVGLHSYGVSEGRLSWIIYIALLHCGLAALAFIPARFWASELRNNVAP